VLGLNMVGALIRSIMRTPDCTDCGLSEGLRRKGAPDFVLAQTPSPRHASLDHLPRLQATPANEIFQKRDEFLKDRPFSCVSRRKQCLNGPRDHEPRMHTDGHGFEAAHLARLRGEAEAHAEGAWYLRPPASICG